MLETSLQTTQPTTPKTRKLVSTYVEMYAAFEEKALVSKNEYRLILKYFNNLLRKCLVKNAEVFNLPYSIGTLGVSSAPPPRPNSKPLDFQHYKETGEKRVLMNLNTEGRILKLVLKAKPNSLYFN